MPAANIKTASWKFAVTSLPTASTAAVVVDYLEKPLDVLYTRRRSSYCELAVTIENRDDIHALSAAGYRRCLLGIRNNLIRFHGQITEHTETQRGYEIVAKDPYYNLLWRNVTAPPLTGLSYTSLGDAEIAMRLIEHANGVWPTFLNRGSIENGANRSRKFNIGDKISDKVEYMASLLGAFEFTIGATYGVVGELAKFNTHSPYDVLADASFEFGQDTLNNVQSYARVLRPLINKKTLVARYGKHVAATDVPSRNAYGLWEDWRGQVDINENTPEGIEALDQIVQGDTMPQPHYALDITPGPTAPQLFTDFDVYNSVQVLIKNFGIQRTWTRPVLNVAIRLDPASGVENMETLTLLDPDEPEE